MKSNFLKILFLVILAVMLAAQPSVWAATSRSNPFLTLQEEDFFGQDYSDELTNLKLSGLFFSPGNSYAVIDGKVVREKEMIYDKEVVRITDKDVMLKDPAGSEFIIRVGKIQRKLEAK